MHGWRLETVHHDLMHIMNLGVLMTLIGSVMAEMVDEGWIPYVDRGPDVALKALYLNYKKWCNDNKVSYTPAVFSMNLIGRGTSTRWKYPELSSTVKAANMIILASFLYTTLAAVSDEGRRTGLMEFDD